MLQRTRLLRSNCEKLMYVSRLQYTTPMCTRVIFQPYDFSYIGTQCRKYFERYNFRTLLFMQKSFLTSKISQTSVINSYCGSKQTESEGETPRQGLFT